MYTYVHTYIYIYIYIYIWRERERDVYVCICLYICREREREIVDRQIDGVLKDRAVGELAAVDGLRAPLHLLAGRWRER